ncbi:MAG: hypothetical protein P4L51_17685 [Puia sp.]|nr:hypothetical protein [Puia sp.]
MQDNEPSKKDQYHIWRLIGQKLAGNASKSELLELQELLQDNPHIQYSMEILTGLTDPGLGSAGRGGPGKNIPENGSDPVSPLNRPQESGNNQQARVWTNSKR